MPDTHLGCLTYMLIIHWFSLKSCLAALKPWFFFFSTVSAQPKANEKGAKNSQVSAREECHLQEDSVTTDKMCRCLQEDLLQWTNCISVWPTVKSQWIMTNVYVIVMLVMYSFILHFQKLKIKTAQLEKSYYQCTNMMYSSNFWEHVIRITWKYYSCRSIRVSVKKYWGKAQ